jgi:hypothetical protein
MGAYCLAARGIEAFVAFCVVCGIVMEMVKICQDRE